MGAIDNAASRIATSYDSKGNSTASTSGSASGATGSTSGTENESQAVGEGYEQFAQETTGTTNFNQNTWNTYAQQLGAKVGQDGGSLNAGVVDAAEASEATKSAGNTASQHMLPPGTQLKFEDGSQYTVKPGDTISYESLQQYMPNTQTQTNDGSPDASQGYKAVTDPSNPLAPANNDAAAGPDGTKPHHKDYYANLDSPDNPNNPYGLYNVQAMAQAMSGTTASTASTSGSSDPEHPQAAAAQGKS